MLSPVETSVANFCADSKTPHIAALAGIVLAVVAVGLAPAQHLPRRGVGVSDRTRPRAAGDRHAGKVAAIVIAIGRRAGAVAVDEPDIALLRPLAPAVALPRIGIGIGIVRARQIGGRVAAVLPVLGLAVIEQAARRAAARARP